MPQHQAIQIFFEGTHAAAEVEACQLLRSAGFGVGRKHRQDRRVIRYDAQGIDKWKNLSPPARKSADAQLVYVPDGVVIVVGQKSSSTVAALFKDIAETVRLRQAFKDHEAAGGAPLG